MFLTLVKKVYGVDQMSFDVFITYPKDIQKLCRLLEYEIILSLSKGSRKRNNGIFLVAPATKRGLGGKGLATKKKNRF